MMIHRSLTAGDCLDLNVDTSTRGIQNRITFFVVTVKAERFVSLAVQRNHHSTSVRKTEVGQSGGIELERNVGPVGMNCNDDPVFIHVAEREKLPDFDHKVLPRVGVADHPIAVSVDENGHRHDEKG
jgi:hypothetical protein